MPIQFHGEQAGIEDLPPWEPDDANLIDLNDLPEEDPVRAGYFAKPFVLSVQVVSDVVQQIVRC